MADAMCGPSIALQTFQKHAQVDRSLQQDRSAFRPRQHENFRTSSGPSNAHVDAEFEAFQSGQIPSAQAFAPHAAAAGFHHHHAPPPAMAHSPLPAWAADFQQLNIHEARQSPIPAARFRHEAPLLRSSGASWHAEFLRHEKTAAPTPAPAAAAVVHPSFSPTFGQQQGFMGAGFGAGMHSFAPGAQAQQPMDMFDDAAFEAAFDSAAAMVAQPREEQGLRGKSKGKGKARASEKQQQQAPMAAAESQQEQFSMDYACVEPPEPFFADIDEAKLTEMTFRDTAADMMKPFSSVTQEALLARNLLQEQDTDPRYPLMSHEKVLLAHQNDFLQSERERMEREQAQEQERERMDPALEADELSRTAGQLLDNLRHEQGEKFAKSSFMALMRQLRDREVKVEGDNFVETAQALHPGGPTYPHDAFQHRPPRVPE